MMSWMYLICGLFSGLGLASGGTQSGLNSAGAVAKADPIDTVIVAPVDDVEISAGETVVFEGAVVGPTVAGVTINWQVNGGLVTRHFRGEIVSIPFPRAGQYQVFCAARNAAGESDPTPDSRRVTVRSAVTAVETEIVVPADDVIIAAGSSIDFRAEGQPQNVSFEWEIARSGAITATRYQTGELIDVTFDFPGLFEVTCTSVTDNGQRDPTPAKRMVDVVTLEAEILQPPGLSLTVPPGTEIPFQGATVAASSGSVSASWYLQGRPDDRVHGNSARFVFSDLGTFSVVFEVTDDLGNVARDHRVIHVSESGALGVEILEPEDGSIFSVNELIDLRGRLFGATEQNSTITWTLAGQAFSTLEVQDVMVPRPGRYNLSLIAALPDQRVAATDQIMIEVYDPNQGLRTAITRPLTDLTIVPGDTVFFDGSHRNTRAESDVGPLWQVTGIDTEEIVLEAHRRTLGRVTFPEEGEFRVSFAMVGPSFVGPTDIRRIRVAETSPEIFEDNDTPERAVTVEPGRYRNLRLVRPNYFKLLLNQPASTLKIDVEFDGAALFDVFRKAGTLDWTRIRQGQLAGSGGFQVTNVPAGEYLIRLEAGSAKYKGDLDFGIGLSVLQPVLFLPDIREDAEFGSWIGLVNPNAEPAEIDVTAFGAAGSILDRTSADLQAFSRLHLPVTSLFGDLATQVAWIRVDASLQINGYTVCLSHDQTQAYATTAAQKLSSELFVPHIAQQTQQWYSRASIVNGSPNQSQSMLLTQAEDQELAVDMSFSQDAFDFVEKFGGSLPESAQWGWCAEENQALLLAGSEVFGKVDGNRQVAGLILDDVQQSNPNFLYLSRNIYFSHIARDVAQFWTGLALVNVSSQTQTARMRAFGSGGAPIGTLDLELMPGEKRVDVAEAFLGELGTIEDIDWVVLEADQAIVGYELFGTHDNQRLAGLEAGTALSNRLTFPFIDSSGASWHGISLVNVHDTETQAVLTLYDDVGTALATETVALNGREKLAITLTQLFGTLPPTAGWVLCEADQSIIGFELVGDHGGQRLSALSAL